MAEIVNTELADECIAEYNNMYINGDPALLQPSTYTESVSFSFEDVEKFMRSAAEASADTLQIKFGIYTQAFADKYGVTPGRLSVFLCTKRKGGYGDPPHDIMNVGVSEP